MTEKQTKYYFYGKTRNSQDPLDPRLKISSLSAIDAELKIQYRYNGLIFHVKDINKMYVFLNDLNNPIDLSNYISGNIVFGIEDEDEDYSNLLNNLNNTNPTLGSLVTVFPLGVTFQYDGNNWKYFSGTYVVPDDETLESIPNELRKLNAEILVNDVLFMFDATLSKSTPIIIIEAGQGLPFNPINGRIYSSNKIYFYHFNGEWIRLGDKVYIGATGNFFKGENIVVHNLGSMLIQSALSISIPMENEVRTIHLDLIPITPNEAKFISKVDWIDQYATIIIRAVN